MTSSSAWSCPSCSTTHVDGSYCKSCGERRLTPHDDTLRGVLHQWAESLVHIDGRIVRSCRELLTKPGELTAAHIAGRRRPYIAPFQLFLVMNLVFFITQGLTGLSILSIPLALHVDEWYGALATEFLQLKLAASGTTFAAYAPLFDQKVAVIAKSLVIVMVPMLALCLAVCLLRLRRAAPTHLVFATHFYGFMLLFLTLLFPAAALTLRALGAVGLQAEWSTADGIISMIELAAVSWYFLRALPRVYGLKGWRNGLASALLIVAVIVLLRAYRAVQFGVALLIS